MNGWLDSALWESHASIKSRKISACPHGETPSLAAENRVTNLMPNEAESSRQKAVNGKGYVTALNYGANLCACDKWRAIPTTCLRNYARDLPPAKRDIFACGCSLFLWRNKKNMFYRHFSSTLPRRQSLFSIEQLSSASMPSRSASMRAQNLCWKNWNSRRWNLLSCVLR